MATQPESPYRYPRWSARITVRMTEAQLDRIDKVVDTTGTDRSDVIRAAVKFYLDSRTNEEREAKK